MEKFQVLFLVELQRRLKTILQIGNKLHVNYSSKNENRIGYFKIEILNAYSPLYFDHKQKLSCITTAINLIKILTADSQANNKVYDLINNLFLILKDEDWLKRYIFWELELLKLLGYDLELENLVEKDIVENETVYYASSSSEKKYVPNFLIEKDLKVDDVKTLLSGLKLVGDYLDKTILKPNNLIIPIVDCYLLILLNNYFIILSILISIITNNCISSSSFKCN